MESDSVSEYHKSDHKIAGSTAQRESDLFITRVSEKRSIVKLWEKKGKNYI